MQKVNIHIITVLLHIANKNATLIIQNRQRPHQGLQGPEIRHLQTVAKYMRKYTWDNGKSSQFVFRNNKNVFQKSALSNYET